jgi:sucrose-phosphate synthase
MELGRDPDTGGQVLYVVELARALARQKDVARVELITRLIVDSAVSDDYAATMEDLGDGAKIVRIEAGPAGYIPKEQLWDHLDAFVDNTLTYVREQDRLPDVVHSHYADAGFVGGRMSMILGVPQIHTGHSLGRVKRRRLLAAGLDAEEIEKRFNMTRRVEAEEQTLSTAERVVTSTHQEIEEQYALYDQYQPDQMRVIPPGTDLERFRPPTGNEWDTPIGREVRRFLREPRKPLILALSRADRRKNLGGLLEAYGESPALQKAANLLIVAGNRDDITDMDEGPREVLRDLLHAIDRYDLYGRVAYPKQHAPDDVPVIYRLAATSGGVFINPAITEPFGLTLLEAAASGLPLVATEDGGPRDIIANCRNGVLVDPLDGRALANALLAAVRDSGARQEWVRNGLRGVREHYSWKAHALRYIDMVRPVVDRTEVLDRKPRGRRPMLYHDRAIFTDLDQNLLGDVSTLPQLIGVIQDNRKCATFGVATGRRVDSALKVMRKHGIPEPDVLITSGGTEIYYEPDLTADTAWTEHIDHHWTPRIVHRVLDGLPGLKLQPKQEQSRFKIGYYIDPKKAPSLDEINSLLRKEEQSVNVILSFGQFLDVLPVRASKGLALRYFATRWDIPLEQILVAGGSGADEDMMRGMTLGVVVRNRHHEELSKLVDLDRVYFAGQPYARGIVEALDHYDFFGACNVPSEASETA